jgi:hypothetical protein
MTKGSSPSSDHVGSSELGASFELNMETTQQMIVKRELLLLEEDEGSVGSYRRIGVGCLNLDDCEIGFTEPCVTITIC